MTDTPSTRWLTLLQRELREYRVSLLITPVALALLLTGLMLISVLAANRIAAVGQTFMEVVTEEGAISGMNISIQIDEDTPEGKRPDYRVEENVDPAEAGDWNFSRQWRFNPPSDTGPAAAAGAPAAGSPAAPDTAEADDERDTGKQYSLNPLLSVVNVLMTVILVVVTINYLLGSLFDDRRDRSILFWKSMPVSEWEVVLSKLLIALVVAPLVYLAVSLLAQVVCTLLAMLTIWRMDRDPVELVLNQIHFGRLIADQVGGWLVVSLWVAPIYGWLLAASAAARRSPFMVAVVPVVVLVLGEQILFGTEYIGGAIASHFPHNAGGGSDVGGALQFFLFDSVWSSGQLISLAGGLACAAALVAAAVWLRRHRWEI